MFKKISLFTMFFISSLNLHSNNLVNFTEAQQDLYNDLGKSIPLLKSLPEEFSDSQSAQKVYFEIKDSFDFNRAVMPYYLNNTENFQGYSSKNELIFHIPELTGIYNQIKGTSNKVTKFRLDKIYKEKFTELSNDFDINFFNDKIYYSEIPLKGAFPYNFEKNKKTVLFSDYQTEFPAIYLTCFTNGDVVATFSATKFSEDKISIPSFVTNTTIFLEVSQEIKNYVKHRYSKYGENLCSNTRTFNSIEDGEIFEGFSNDKANTYMGFFTIDKNVTNKPYLVGKLSHIGFFIMDNDFYHMPFDMIGGQTFNEKNAESIPDRVYEKTINKGNFSSTFLNSQFSYSFNDFFIKGIDNNQLRLIKNNTNLHILYDYEVFENEIIFTLSKIIKESPDAFPLKFRVTKEKDLEGAELSVFILYNKIPFMYIKESLDFKNGLFLDWNKLIEEEK